MSDLTEFHKQGFYTTESYDESKKYYLLRGTDLTGNKLTIHDDTPKINASEKESNDFKVEVGDVLLVRSGGVGTYGIVYDEVQGIFGSYLIDFRFDQTQMLNEFFGYFYESDLFKQQLRRISQQSANLNINAENIKSISIDLPSIEEQKKIEGILKQIDNLIALQQRQLDLYIKLKKGLLQKLFPKDGEKVPEVRFTDFHGDWEQHKFQEILDKNNGIRRGPFGSSLKKDLFVKNSDYVVYEQQNAIYNNFHTRYFITKEKFQELIKFELNPGDFIMSGAGTIGKIAKVPNDIKKGVFNQALIRFRINNSIMDGRFFLQWMRSEFMQRRLTSSNPGSAIVNLIPMSELKKWTVIVPKRDEQKVLGKILNKLDSTIALQHEQLDELKSLKKYLLQKLFI